MRTPLLSPNRRVRPPAIARADDPEPGDNLRGAGLMVMCMTLFTLNDTVIKFVTQELPLYQAMTLRGAVVMVLLVVLAQRKGGLDLRVTPADRWPLALRTIGEVGSTLLFVNALTMMPIGDLSAIMQSLPLLVMLGAALVFGERLGWRRLMAVCVGLVGVLMILRPGSAAFGLASILGLASVLLVVLRDLSTRVFARSLTSETIAFYAACAVTGTSLVMSLGQGWQSVSLSLALLLILGGTFLTGGYLTAVASMRVGEISYVAPFRYVSLVVAIILGLVVFGEWPDGWTWAGSALVVSAGIYSIWREARLRGAGG